MKIATYQGNNLLNKKTKLISKCRQQNKYIYTYFNENVCLILYFIIIYMQHIDYGGEIVYVQGSNSYGTWERAASSPIGVWGLNTIQMQET